MQNNKKIAFIFGTRPEILKVYPLIKEAEARGVPHVLIHTNQHYSREMDKIFFEELGIRAPEYNLNVGSGSHNSQTAKMLLGLDEVLTKEKPSIIVVQGDTNSTLAGALAGSKLGIKVAHVEAGLRSYDREMPEEVNRIITDSISDYLFPVTEVQKKILLSEGINEDKVLVSGNTIVDTLILQRERAQENKTILKRFNLSEDNYFLLTMHRPSNVDDSETLKRILNTLNEIAEERNTQILWPIHPRTKQKIEQEGIDLPKQIKTCEPLGYKDFLSLIIHSHLILTDSGGIQEEACILMKPCVTLRKNTERPETVSVGANKLAFGSKEKIKEAVEYFDSCDKSWTNPFGDGKAAEKIMEALLK